MYIVLYKKKVNKIVKRLPLSVQNKFLALLKDLKEKGPVQTGWMNYSKLSVNTYHCHLDYHYVACWKHENRTIEIEVSYVGSRENAPY